MIPYRHRFAEALAALEPHERAEVFAPAVAAAEVERPLLLGATGQATCE